MVVTVGEVVSVLKFIKGVLEEATPADYGKSDFDNLIAELTSLDLSFQRAIKIDSTDLQQLLEEDKIHQDIQDIKRELEIKKRCPVACNDPKMNILYRDLCKEGKTLEEARAVAGHRTVIQCVEHPADTQFTDTMKTAGYETKVAVKTVIGAPLAPLAGLLGLALGAIDASRYNSHKSDISKVLKDLTRKLKSVGRRMDHILLVINTEDTAYMKKMLKNMEDKSK